MTAIKTIIEAEKQAEEIISNAREAAQKDIADAKKKQGVLLDQVDIELMEEQAKQIQEQKVDLSFLYKKILDEGKTKVENFKKDILAKHQKALLFVLDSFVK